MAWAFYLAVVVGQLQFHCSFIVYLQCVGQMCLLHLVFSVLLVVVPLSEPSPACVPRFATCSCRSLLVSPLIFKFGEAPVQLIEPEGGRCLLFCILYRRGGRGYLLRVATEEDTTLVILLGHLAFSGEEDGLSSACVMYDESLVLVVFWRQNGDGGSAFKLRVTAEIAAFLANVVDVNIHLCLLRYGNSTTVRKKWTLNYV